MRGLDPYHRFCTDIPQASGSLPEVGVCAIAADLPYGVGLLGAFPSHGVWCNCAALNLHVSVRWTSGHIANSQIRSGPCCERPLCVASIVDGVAHGNDVHIAIQAPVYMLISSPEVFAPVTSLEYAYMKAPASMKSFVQSMCLLTNASGAALGESPTPVA
jgi:hypothetical protein